MYTRGTISETLRAFATLGVGEKGLALGGLVLREGRAEVSVMRGHVFWWCGVREARGTCAG